MKPETPTYNGHFTTETHSSHLTESPRGGAGQIDNRSDGTKPIRSNAVGPVKATSYPVKSFGGPIAQIQRGKGTQHVTPGTKPPKGVNTRKRGSK